MKITEAIKEFKQILKKFQNKTNDSYYLCHNTDNKQFIDLFRFFNDSYYKNYVGSFALTMPYECYNNDDLLVLWKIKFMKTEIILLQKLLDNGYTDI